MRQISSLQKGLIFNPDLSEWGQGRDLVSGVIPTNTAVFPVLDSRGNGRRWLDLNGTSSYITLPTLPAFGTGDFSVVVKFTPRVVNQHYNILGNSNAANAFELLATNTGYFRVNIGAGTPYAASTAQMVINVENTIGYTRTGTTGTYYLNGVACGTITDNNNYTQSVLHLGSGQWAIFKGGTFTMCRVFNYALTAQQITNYNKPEYPIEWVDRGNNTLVDRVVNGNFSSATGWSLETGWNITGGAANANGTAGGAIYQNNLIAGNTYKITYTISNYVNGNVRCRCGSVYGTSRTASGTYVEYIAANSSLLAIYDYGAGGHFSIDDVKFEEAKGCILDLNAEGMASATWVDKTNSLTATNSGTTFVLPSASNLGAIFFNGSSAFVDCGDRDSLTLPNTEFSFGLNLYALSVPSSTAVIWKNNEYLLYLVSGGSPSANYTPVVYLTDNNNLSNRWIFTGSALSINTLYKIIFVFSGGNGYFIINGVKVIATKTVDGTGFSAFANTANSLIIGKYTSTFFNGRLSKLFIYGKALTDDEITFVNSIL